ncbi:Protein LONG AFTER FAR-RED 3 [Bienertia sinuspersici]
MMNTLVILLSFLVFIISIFLLHPFSELSKLKESEVADLLVKNGFIYTSDPALPFADSMAIKNGRILGLGNYSALQGKVVTPGFIDSHVHLLYGGLQMAQVEFHGVSTKQEFIMKIEAAVKTKKEGFWVLGGGWNNELWEENCPCLVIKDGWSYGLG